MNFKEIRVPEGILKNIKKSWESSILIINSCMIFINACYIINAEYN